MDGKHVTIQAPANSESMYSITTTSTATAYANYNFVCVDVGSQGKNSDGMVLANSAFGKRLKSHDLDLPPPAVLPGTNIALPHAFVADEAFPLHENIMRPYGGSKLPKSRRIFIYRLSRARRIVENAFGIIPSRFRVFRRPLSVKLETEDVIVLASTALHNFLRRKTALRYIDGHTADYEDLQGNVVQGQRRNKQDTAGLRPLRGDTEGLRPLRGNSVRRSDIALHSRMELTKYFMSEVGAVPWQSSMI